MTKFIVFGYFDTLYNETGTDMGSLFLFYEWILVSYVMGVEAGCRRRHPLRVGGGFVHGGAAGARFRCGLGHSQREPLGDFLRIENGQSRTVQCSMIVYR